MCSLAGGHVEVSAGVGGLPKPSKVPLGDRCSWWRQDGSEDCVKNGPVVEPVGAEVMALSSELQRLRAENARLTRL